MLSVQIDERPVQYLKKRFRWSFCWRELGLCLVYQLFGEVGFPNHWCWVDPNLFGKVLPKSEINLNVGCDKYHWWWGCALGMLIFIALFQASYSVSYCAVSYNRAHNIYVFWYGQLYTCCSIMTCVNMSGYFIFVCFIFLRTRAWIGVHPIVKFFATKAAHIRAKIWIRKTVWFTKL